jgi:hypothetical protein
VACAISLLLLFPFDSIIKKCIPTLCIVAFAAAHACETLTQGSKQKLEYNPSCLRLKWAKPIVDTTNRSGKTE